MPRSKPRKARPARAGQAAGKGRSGGSSNRLAIVALGFAVVAGGAYFWTARQPEEAATDGFVALVEAGQPALARVRTIPSQGNGHLAPGQTKTYAAPFPTSGDHASQGFARGFMTPNSPSRDSCMRSSTATW